MDHKGRCRAPQPLDSDTVHVRLSGSRKSTLAIGTPVRSHRSTSQSTLTLKASTERAVHPKTLVESEELVARILRRFRAPVILAGGLWYQQRLMCNSIPFRFFDLSELIKTSSLTEANHRVLERSPTKGRTAPQDHGAQTCETPMNPSGKQR